MFAFNPNLKEERSIKSDTLGALRQLSGASDGIVSVLRNMVNQKNIKNLAKAKVDADFLSNKNKVIAAAQANTNQVAATDKATGVAQNVAKTLNDNNVINSDTDNFRRVLAAIVANTNKVKAKALDNVNKIKAVEAKNKTDTYAADAAQANAIINENLRADNVGRNTNTAIQGNIDLEKLRQLGSKTSESTFDKTIGKTLAERFTRPEYENIQRGKVNKAFDEDNLFFDAEFGNDIDKSVVDEIIFQAADDPTKAKYLAGGKEAMYNLVNKELAKRGQRLDESTFGEISIVKLDYEDTIDKIKNFFGTSKDK